MADFYCDISAIGNEYQAYTDTPTTWAVPQDGNGKAGPGHAAAVAIATIDCASASASGAGILGVLGVTVSSTLTGSGATLATNITTAINASATATGASYSALLLPLNKLIFARVNPGMTTQVQIMLRIAGTDWNGMVPVSSGTWGTAPTMGAFASGADGPFAYLGTTATVFGKTSLTYGLWFAVSACVTDPTEADVVHVRTGRSSVGLSFTLSLINVEKLWRSRIYLYDDGTVWTGISTTLTLVLINTATTGTSVLFRHATNAGTIGHISRSKYNFSVDARTESSATAVTSFLSPSNSAGNTTPAKSMFIRCSYVASAGSVGDNTLSYNPFNSYAYTINLSESLLQAPKLKVMNDTSSASVARLIMNNFVVAVTAATGVIPALIIASNANFGGQVSWVGGRVYDTNGVFSCANPFSFGAAIPNIELVCDGVVGVTDPSIGFTATDINAMSRLVWSNLQGPARGFRYETPSFVTDWKGNGTFPHCGAVSLQGDSWSHRITWKAASSMSRPITAQRLGYFYRSAAAAKTVTLELYVPDASTLYTDELILSVSYLDSGDVWRVESSATAPGLQLAASGRTALASSAKSWTANGVAAYSAKKLTLLTSQPIKQNTELLITLALASSKSPAITLYASPEVGVA